MPENVMAPAAHRARAASVHGALLVAAAALIALGSAAALWWLPFAVGLCVGVARGTGRARRGAAVLFCTLAALAGWAAPLLWRAADHEPVAATSRSVAALAGLPATSALLIAVTLLVAVGQALLGQWCAGSVTAALRGGRGRADGTAGAPS